MSQTTTRHARIIALGHGEPALLLPLPLEDDGFLPDTEAVLIPVEPGRWILVLPEVFDLAVAEHLAQQDDGQEPPSFVVLPPMVGRDG